MTLILSGTDGLSDVDGSAATPAIRGTDANTGIFFPAADTIAFSEGGVEAMRIDSSGRVGIGVTPSISSARLTTVGGPVQLSPGTTSQEGIRLTRASGICQINGINNDNNAYNSITFATGASEAMRIDTAGNVGIGTTNPQAKLHVNTTSAALYIGYGGNFDNYIQTNNNTYFTNYNGATEYGRFDSSGNFRFNSGYGSSATAYGCRAWVNFNGTGTVAIRGSGNVTSITDNGTGNYTVNFTTAMPDANYSFVASCGNDDNNGMMASPQSPTFATGSARFVTRYHDNGAADSLMTLVAVFR